VYAAIFFLTPMMASTPAILAWIGGALFTANFVNRLCRRRPYPATERDSPAGCRCKSDGQRFADRARRRAACASWFNDVLLYFLDEHAYRRK
jgi:hypothetical protein